MAMTTDEARAAWLNAEAERRASNRAAIARLLYAAHVTAHGLAGRVDPPVEKSAR